MLYPKVSPRDLQFAVQPQWWLPLAELFAYDPFSQLTRPLSLSEERGLLGIALQRWLDMGEVQLRMTWPPGAVEPVLEQVANGLFGALALALATHLVGGVDSAICRCGRTYLPRLRRADLRYCPECREKGVPKRDSELRRRRRRRAEGLGGGVHVAEEAKR